MQIVGIDSLGCEDDGGGGTSGGGTNGGGTAGGGAPAPASPGPPTKSCNTNNKAAGTAYAAIGATNPVFNDIGSNANAPYGQEASGWIYADEQGDFKYDPPTTTNLNASGETTLPPQGNYPGWTVTGYYHTHPHQPGADPTQTQDGLHFSQADINSLDAGQIGYVAVLDSIGTADEQNPQVRWYSYNKSTRTETLLGNVGSGGC